MTKKLALFLFALGMGVTSTVLASDAYYCFINCNYEYTECMNSGAGSAVCGAERSSCRFECQHPNG